MNDAKPDTTLQDFSSAPEKRRATQADKALGSLNFAFVCHI
jgi:hypothetical protein